MESESESYTIVYCDEYALMNMTFIIKEHTHIKGIEDKKLFVGSRVFL